MRKNSSGPPRRLLIVNFQKLASAMQLLNEQI